MKVNASSDESFCSSDDQPPTTNSSSTFVDGFITPMSLPASNSRCPPPSVVDAAGQSFGSLPTFAGYPFPVLPPASTSGLMPPPPPGYRFALGATSRGRIQRQSGVKSSTKMTSPITSRTRSHVGSYLVVIIIFVHHDMVESNFKNNKTNKRTNSEISRYIKYTLRTKTSYL